MISFTVLAYELVLWQSSDISVSIVSSADNGGKGDVKISVLNTAGSTLLFYENPEMSGKIEYLSDSGWVEYCDISYTTDNAKAISPQYGGIFAELEPGEVWNVSVSEEAVKGMKNGTYRIKMTYITAKNFKRYIDSAFENRNSESESFNSESDYGENVSGADSSASDPAADSEAQADSFLHFIKNDESAKRKPPKAKEEFLAASLSEVYIKTFDFTGSEDIVSKINIEPDDISEVKDNPKIRSRRIPDGNSAVLP